MTESIPDDSSPAQLLHFPRKRGRPKTIRPKTDIGTPELILKRLHGHTAEALDLCLERAIISERQHWCGVHLRWLYTLRHGVPSVRAIDPTHLGGAEPKPEDPQWRTAREKEYNDAIRALSQSGHALMLLNICVYNERPAFLDMPKPTLQKNINRMADTIAKLRDGLDVLDGLW